MYMYLYMYIYTYILAVAWATGVDSFAVRCPGPLVPGQRSETAQ